MSTAANPASRKEPIRPHLSAPATQQGGPGVLVLAGHGLNCEHETAFAFEQAGARAEIRHIDDQDALAQALGQAQILAVPGGFSFGDHLGAGKALAARLTARVDEALLGLVERGGLVLGVCNGAQILLKTGLFEGAGVTLAPNAGGAYLCQWERLQVSGSSDTPWLAGLEAFDCPIAHGEGRFAFAPGALERLQQAGGDALRYDGAAPNGSTDRLAGITAHGGRVLAMMPHPERALLSHHHPDFHRRAALARRRGEALTTFGPTLRMFRNAVEAAKQ